MTTDRDALILGSCVAAILVLWGVFLLFDRRKRRREDRRAAVLAKLPRCPKPELN